MNDQNETTTAEVVETTTAPTTEIAKEESTMITTTVILFAQSNEIDYGVANAILQMAVDRGIGKVMGSAIREDKRRGKRSKIFQVPASMTFNFNPNCNVTSYKPLVAKVAPEVIVVNGVATTAEAAIAAMTGIPTPNSEATIIQTVIATPEPTVADLVTEENHSDAEETHMLSNLNEVDMLADLAALEADMMSDK